MTHQDKELSQPAEARAPDPLISLFGWEEDPCVLYGSQEKSHLGNAPLLQIAPSGQVPDYGRDVMEWLRCCRPLLHKKRYPMTPSKRKRPENKARNPRGNHKILYSHPPKYIKGCMSSHMGRSKDHTIKRSIKNHRITPRYPLPLSPSRFLHCMNTRLSIPNPQNTILLDIKLRSPNKDKSPMSLSVLSAQATEDPHTDLQQTKRCMSQF